MTASVSEFGRLDELFGGGNDYRHLKPFYTIPSWWRGFFFAVLSAREVAIYNYIAAHSNRHGEAWPTYEAIQADLNLNNPRIVSKSLRRLEECGFLLKRSAPPPRRRSRTRHKRNIYRRPSLPHTLYTLLAGGFIDGDLRPILASPSKITARALHEQDGPDGTVRAGLRNLIGEAAASHHSRLPAGERRAFLIKEMLDLRLRYQREYDELLLSQKPQPTVSAPDDFVELMDDGTLEL